MTALDPFEPDALPPVALFVDRQSPPQDGRHLSGVVASNLSETVAVVEGYFAEVYLERLERVENPEEICTVDPLVAYQEPYAVGLAQEDIPCQVAEAGTVLAARAIVI